MHYILFILWLAFFCWVTTRVSFFKKSGLSARLILILFLIKIFAGVAVGWLTLHYYGTDIDYWDMNKQGWKEYKLLFSQPGSYFSNMFKSAYPNGYDGLFDTVHSFWNDFRNAIVVKVVTIFDIFSRGDYYINSIFFNFLCFFSHVALYMIFIQLFTNRKKFVIIGVFLLPSTLIFSSGLHKDCAIFFLQGMFCYYCFQAIRENKLTWKKLLVLVILFSLLFFIRNFIALLIIPALIAWLISSWRNWSPVRTFIIMYAATALIFFNTNGVVPQINFPQVIVDKQNGFLQLPPGNTDIYIHPLYPHFRSFLNNTPQAVNHILVRPYLTESSSRFLFLFAIEIFFYELIFFLFILFPVKDKGENPAPFILFAVFFTLSIFLNIGYTIPNLGALIRYRSLYLPFLITPMLCLINWGKIRELVRIKK